MALDRVDLRFWAERTGTSHGVDLPDGQHIELAARFINSIVPVLLIPGGYSPQGEDGNALKLPASTRVVGTAFSIAPREGVFATAAHVLPEAPSGAAQRRELAVIAFVPGRNQADVLPIRVVEVDEGLDVAVCVCQMNPATGDFDYLPLHSRPPRDFSSMTLATAGFPGSLHEKTRIDTCPAFYHGDGAGGEWVTGEFPVNQFSRGGLRTLTGRFFRCEMKALPGLSGGPLVAFEADGHGRGSGKVIGIMSFGNEREGLGYFADI
jgi:hypothetical protein